MKNKTQSLKEEYKNILTTKESFIIEIEDVKLNIENFKWHISSLNESLKVQENQESVDLIHANIEGAKERISLLKFKLEVFKKWKKEIYG